MGTDPRGPGFTRDRTWCRGSRGLTLLAGSPATVFRVTEPGARVLDALERGEPLPSGHEPLTVRLARAGAIHPVPRRAAAVEQVTVVIPAFVGSVEERACLVELVDSLAPLAIVVVDDASTVDVDESLAGSRVEVLRLDTNRGPGAARNAGLARVTTPVVVFIDLDVRVDIDQVLLLAGLVLDGQAALVAPRVDASRTSRVREVRRFPMVDVAATIAAFETHRSPLDMGDQHAVVRPGGRVPYVPSAIVACDAGAVRGIAGFDEQMRTGEDVDLVWRLTDAGATCRYAPSLHASHLPRPTIGRFVRQRLGYGRSAADLSRRHGRRVAPFRSHLLVAAPAVLALLAYPFAAFFTGLVAVAWLAVSLRVARLGIARSLRRAGTALFGVTAMMARAIRREWWPVLGAAAVFSDRAAFAIVASHAIPAIVRLLRDKPGRPISFIVLGILDDAAYGVGVWIGARGRAAWAALLPALGLRTAARPLGAPSAPVEYGSHP